MESWRDAGSRDEAWTKIALAVAALAVALALLVCARIIRHGFSARDEPTPIEAFVARRVRLLATRKTRARSEIPSSRSTTSYLPKRESISLTTAPFAMQTPAAGIP